MIQNVGRVHTHDEGFRFAEISIYELRSVRFCVMTVFQRDDRGIYEMVGDVIKPIGPMTSIADELCRMRVTAVETDDEQLYQTLMLNLYPTTFKYKLETTRRHFDDNKGMLIDLYKLDEVTPAVLPAWRRKLISFLQKQIKRLSKETKQYAN